MTEKQKRPRTVPAHLIRYSCGDFFASKYAVRGFWCSASQLQVIVPAIDAEELPNIDFLAVGRVGVDGILFGYRAGYEGLWAYYPIGQEFVIVAVSLEELIEKWIGGSIQL